MKYFDNLASSGKFKDDDSDNNTIHWWPAFLSEGAKQINSSHALHYTASFDGDSNKFAMDQIFLFVHNIMYYKTNSTTTHDKNVPFCAEGRTACPEPDRQ